MGLIYMFKMICLLLLVVDMTLIFIGSCEFAFRDALRGAPLFKAIGMIVPNTLCLFFFRDELLDGVHYQHSAYFNTLEKLP